MTRPLVAAVILAQLADWASWLGLPAGAERNATAAAAEPLALKAALVVLVLAAAAIADRRRPAIAQAVLIVGIVAGAFGWGTNIGAGLS